VLHAQPLDSCCCWVSGFWFLPEGFGVQQGKAQLLLVAGVVYAAVVSVQWWLCLPATGSNSYVLLLARFRCQNSCCVVYCF
jgi:hypothetical protein